MPNNEQYWKDRSERRILNAEKTASEMTKDLRKLYTDTIDRVNKDIEAFYGRYATETGLTLEDVKKLLTTDELEKFRLEGFRYYEDLAKHNYSPDYKEKLRQTLYLETTKEGRKLYSLRKNITRLDSLKMQMENAVEALYMQQNEQFTTNMGKTYESTYMRSMFDTQQAIGMFTPFEKLNTPLVEKAVSQKWLGENYSDRIWKDKNKLIDTLNTKFTQGVALGQNPKVIAREIKKSTDVKYSNCERLARTEFNHIANQATLDSYESTELEKYQFVATLDFKTSSICQALDNTIHLTKDAQEGVNMPPMHPNCRSTTVPYIEGMDYSKMERLAYNPETGQPYYINQDMSYNDWKNSLTEKEGKYYIANRKMNEQYKSDLKQLKEYKRVSTQAGKQNLGGLFEGMPRNIKEFQQIKYLEPEKYTTYKENYQKVYRDYKKE